MKVVKPLVIAFVVGGLLAMVGQVFFLLSVAIAGPDSLFVPFGTLVGLGLVGGILFIFGQYQKIEKFAQFGAIMPFSGLAAAVAGTLAHAKEEGKGTGGAILAALKLVVYVLGIGSVIAIVIAVVAFFIQ